MYVQKHILRKLIIMKKPLPTLMTDESAEAFIAESDLTEYYLSGLKPVRFEFQPKGKSITRCSSFFVGSTHLKSDGKYNRHFPKIDYSGGQPFLTSHCRL